MRCGAACIRGDKLFWPIANCGERPARSPSRAAAASPGPAVRRRFLSPRCRECGARRGSRASPRPSRQRRCRGRRPRRRRPQSPRGGHPRPSSARKNRTPGRPGICAGCRARADSRQARSASCGRSHRRPNRNRSRGRCPLRSTKHGVGNLQRAMKCGAGRFLHAMVGPQHLRAVGSRDGVVGCLPGCVEANDRCPRGCQSCVSTTLRNISARRLTIVTTSSPRGTASAPPGTKIVLHIDDDENVVCRRVVDGFVMSHAAGELRATGGRPSAASLTRSSATSTG